MRKHSNNQIYNMLNRMLNYVLKWTRLTSSSDCGVSRYRSGFAFIDLVVIAAFCVLITLIVSCSKVEKPTTGNSAATNTENTDLQTDENLATVSYETTSTDKQSWIKFLEEKMLPYDVAEKIVNLNEILFDTLAENDKKELKAQLNQLAKLGGHPSVHSVLREQPEVAGLLAASISHDKNAPEKIAKILNNQKYRLYFKNYCHTHTLDINACITAAEHYEKNGEVIAALYKSGRDFPAPETYFDNNPRSENAREVYNTFRKNFIIDTLQHDSAEDQEGKLQYLFSESFVLINQLDENDDLRINFLDKYFPMLERITEYHRNRFKTNEFLETPYFWHTLKLREGETLSKMYGPEAANRLEKFKAKPEIILQYVIQAMLQHDDHTWRALETLRDKHELVNLLSRSIPDNDKQKVLSEALQNPSRLGYYSRLSDSALLDDLHPYEGWMTDLPCYYIYKIIKKTVNGQEVTAIEVGFAIVDSVLITVEVITIPLTGGASAVAIESLKRAVSVAAGAAAKRAAWQGTKILEKQMLKNGIITAEKNAMKQATKEALEKMPQVLPKMLQKSGGNVLDFSKVTLKLDVSPLAKTGFDKARMLGFKNDTFKKYTGLDARIFMRNDRKVVLNLAALPTVGGRMCYGIPKVIAREIVESAGADAVLGSEPVQRFVLHVKDKITGLPMEKPISYEQYQSSLWLSAATGQLDKMVKEAEKN